MQLADTVDPLRIGILILAVCFLLLALYSTYETYHRTPPTPVPATQSAEEPDVELGPTVQV